MDTENNWIVRSLKSSPAPWHTKQHNPGSNHRQDVLCDFSGKEIAHFVQLSPPTTGEQYRNTLKLIEQAPALLAALVEYAALEDSRGTLQTRLVELILAAGGPNLESRLGQTAPKVSAPAPKTPTVNPKDNVSQTTAKKQRRLQG